MKQLQSAIFQQVLTLLGQSAVVILEPLDVVFSKISTTLDFNENELLFANVFDAVRCAYGNVDRSSRGNGDFAPVQRDPRRSGNDHPVFGTLFVALIAEALLRQNLYTLNFVSWSFIKNRKTPPGTFVKLHAIEDITRT